MKEISEESKQRQRKLAGLLETRPTELTQMTMRIPKLLHQSFKAKASLEGRQMGTILKELVRRYVGGEL